MKTIDVPLLPRERDIDQLSPALCPTAPHCVQLYDSRGRQAPLTLAGFVVQPGRQYEIRARMAKDDMDNVLPQKPRIIDTSEIVDWQSENNEVLCEGQEHWLCLRMTVHRPGVWLRVLGFLWYHTIRTGEVIVEWENAAYPGTPSSIKLPLIVRRPLFHWRLLLWFVAWFAIGMSIEWLWRLVAEDRWSDALLAFRTGDVVKLVMLVNVTWLGVVALSWPLTRILWSLWRVYERAQEMHARFRHKYQPEISPTALAEAGSATA